MSKIDKFYEAKNFFQCPKCKKKIRFHAGGLVCKKEHTFDIAAKGYVNLLQQTKAFKGYDAAFFKSRRAFFGAGYYDHIVTEVTDTVERLFDGAEDLVVLDAGCGEGGYSAAVEASLEARGASGQVLAFDIATDAIKVAAGRHDLSVIKVFDPRERTIPDIGLVNVKDSETGETAWINTSSSKVREAYAKAAQDADMKATKLMRQYQIDSVDISTGSDYVKGLMAFFDRR